jgi:hypothetical protein
MKMNLQNFKKVNLKMIKCIDIYIYINIQLSWQFIFLIFSH